MCDDDNTLNDCASFLFGNFYQMNNKIINELDWQKKNVSAFRSDFILYTWAENQWIVPKV
jgi:hypothetical protein